jgi:hypothetical protein
MELIGQYRSAIADYFLALDFNKEVYPHWILKSNP